MTLSIILSTIITLSITMVQQWTYSHYGSTPDFYAVKVPGSEESGTCLNKGNAPRLWLILILMIPSLNTLQVSRLFTVTQIRKRRSLLVIMATFPLCMLPVFMASSNVLFRWDVFQKGLQRNPNAPCLGKRVVNEDGSYGPYVFMTYKEVCSVLPFSSALCVG